MDSRSDSALIWSPIHEYLVDAIGRNRRLLVVICPFIKVDALRQLLELCDDTTDLKVVVRWAGSDIISGASDLEVYSLLRDVRVPLYVHPTIHLKLLVYNSQRAFVSSGNITLRGLGLTDKPNIELGSEATLSASDWAKVYGILEHSERVDDVMFEQAERYLLDNKEKRPPLPPLQLQGIVAQDFSRLSLPAARSPQVLYEFYSDSSAMSDNDQIPAFMHDLALYDIPDGLSKDSFFSVLRDRFTSHPFVCAIVELIRTHEFARFGLVNEWITANCSDKPTPYRWEMKSVTRRLYDWLSYFFDEISWDIPGAHSMVVRWG